MILLNEACIRQHWINVSGHNRDINNAITIHLFDSIDSTNRFLKELPEKKGPSDIKRIDVCCAETQTQGRGRFGRHWHSPFGENIYCSSRWEFNGDTSQLSGLSLVVSMAVVATLVDFSIAAEVGIKWPNDLLWRGKKLCGSLIELIVDSYHRVAVVIGIGLNVNSNTQDHALLDKPWCSLYEMTGKYVDRNALIARLIIQLHQHLTQFIAGGFPAFIPMWQTMDYLYGQSITVTQPSGLLHGCARGVNEAGQLVLVDDNGTIHYLSSGETSLNIEGIE